MPASPLQVQVQGRTWRMFSCGYSTPDGEFSFYIYALSWEHAQLMLDDIKANAKVDGEIQETVD